MVRIDWRVEKARAFSLKSRVFTVKGRVSLVETTAQDRGRLQEFTVHSLAEIYCSNRKLETPVTPSCIRHFLFQFLLRPRFAPAAGISSTLLGDWLHQASAAHVAAAAEADAPSCCCALLAATATLKLLRLF